MPRLVHAAYRWCACRRFEQEVHAHQTELRVFRDLPREARTEPGGWVNDRPKRFRHPYPQTRQDPRRITCTECLGNVQKELWRRAEELDRERH